MQYDIIVLAIFFVASLVRSGLGFGDALIAMPLLSTFVGLQLGTPVLAVDALIISLILLIIERKQLKLKLLYTFLSGALLGVPIGIYYLSNFPETILKLILGIVVFLFSTYKLFFNKKQFRIPNKMSMAIGLISGILGGAYNTNGPPAIIFAVNNFSEKDFKANLQGMLFPVNIAIISGHFLSGYWVSETYTLFVESLIPISLGLVIGVYISNKINKDIFIKVVWIALMLISLNLIIQNI
ncbi:sulfite exporter TauE/SafE family protein [Candidatus Kapabacteria bacterium]|nr:sulfite exporter TauE/SafE family protein [Candidatus Kapabacteria bacterium]